MNFLVALGDRSAAESLAKLLMEIGWPEPTIATSSTQALEWTANHGGCDVLIADAHLAPLDGFTLRDEIRRGFPQLRAIMTCPPGTPMPLEKIGDDPFLSTPFTPSDLHDCLHEILAREHTPAPATPPPDPTPPQPTPSRLHIGSTLGSYLIESVISQSPSETRYLANQTNIDRTVVLHVLNQELSANPDEVLAFQNRARAKALLSHPRTAAVFEGGQIQNIHFFSTEHISLPTLAERIAAGRPIPGLASMEILQLMAEVQTLIAANSCVSDSVDAGVVHFKRGKPPRLANIAAPPHSHHSDPLVDIARLGRALLTCLDPSPSSASARAVLEKITNPPTTPLTWNHVGDLAREAFPRVVPSTDQIASTPPPPPHRKSPLRLITWALAALLLPAIAITTYLALSPQATRPSIPDAGAMLTVPSGTFLYQGSPVDLPEFLIAKYEVTIGEYAAFLAFLEKNPGAAANLQHPDQPPGKSHIPQNWADTTDVTPPIPGYFNRAKRFGQYQGSPLTLDSPVFGVDWFDAYAYAKWLGRRLPTEQEWEKAALGPANSPFPWGDKPAPKLANTGADFTPNPDPKIGGEIDGFNRWSPVNAHTTDTSAVGAIGTSGNVSEWTASLTDGPGGLKTATIRGGNWKIHPEPATLRITRFGPLHRDDALGFRTATDSPSQP